MAEEYGITPVQARRGLDADPDRLMLTIMEMRAFERIWRQMDPQPEETEPTGALAERVKWAIGERLRQITEGAPKT